MTDIFFEGIMKSERFLSGIFITTIILNHIALQSIQEPYQAKWTSVALNRVGINFNAIIYYPYFVESS